MARRLTAEEKKRLLEQDFWSRYNAEREAITASGAGREVTDLEQSIWDTSQRPDFSGVTTGSPFDEGGSTYVRAQDRQDRQGQAGLLGDLVLDAAASGIDIGANLIDMVSPDPNALSRDTSNPFQNALENTIDTGLRVPVILDDGVRGAFARLSPTASPEAVDAIMRTINFYGAGARDVVAQREAEAAERIASGTDISRTGWVNETADSVRNVANTTRSQRTPETQEAVRGLGQALDSGVVDTAKFLASGQGVRALASVTASSAPWAALGFGTGGLGAAVGLPSSVATAGAGATMFSALATSNAAQAEGAILDLSDEEAVQSPVIADLLARGLDINQAKRAAGAQARFSTIAAMVPAAPLYAMGTFERLGAGVGHREAVLQTLRSSAARGTAREMGQEFVQEGSERYAANVGEIAAGVRDESDRYEGVAGSGVLGAVAAGPLAGAASYASARTDLDNRANELLAVADRLEQGALRRAQQREELEQAAFEEQTMESLVAQDAQRAFIGAAPVPTTDGIDNAGRTTESFEQYAAREGAAVVAAEEAQRQFLAQNTLESSNAALQNSLREGPRGAVSTELTGTRASRRTENERLAASAASDQQAFNQEELDQAAFEEETMARLNGEVAPAQAEAVAEEGPVSVAQARGVLNRMKGQQKAQETKAVNRRLAAIAKSNPDITPEALARAANTGVSPVTAPVISKEDLLAAGLTEAEADAEIAQAAAEAPVAATPADREAALRARTGRADATAGEAQGTPRAAADVVRELAGRVRKGNDSEALAQEQLLKTNKLSIVDGDRMAALAPEAPNARGYYNGEKMYINAARIPEGNASGAVLQEILAHEADHAARLSGNADVKSRVRTMLGDTATDKLLEQLRTSSHRDAVAARDLVASVGVDEATDLSRFEDELTAYAITSAVRNKDGSVWAPIRGMVSAARRKFKQYTGSDEVNLDDLAGYAQDVINALATSEEGVAAADVARADASVEGLMADVAASESAPEHERLLAERLAPMMTQFDVQLRPAEESELLSRDPNAAGVYNSGTNSIHLRTADNITVLHEGLHAVTRNLLAKTSVGKDDPKLGELRREFDDMLEALRGHVLDGALNSYPRNVQQLFLQDAGAMSSTWELLSYGMTEPDVQDVLSKLPAPKKSKFANMWQWFKDAVAKFYGDTSGERSFLDQLIENTGALVEYANTNPGTTRRANAAVAQDYAVYMGRADDSADAVPTTSAPYVRSPLRRAKTHAANLFMSRGAAGKEAFLLREEAEQARDAVYATAVSHNGLILGGIDKAAARLARQNGTTAEAEAANIRDMLNTRLAAISKIPSQSRRDGLIARMVQEYPELAPVQTAINDINALTQNIVDTRMKDPTPLTEDEIKLYEYLLDNKSAYFTNMYALFQGKTGEAYADKILKGAASGYKALAEGKQIPATVRDEFRIYDNALKFVINNDIAVQDPVMLDALSTEDLSNLYDLWATRGESADNLRTRMENEGGFDLESYRGHMADYVAERVALADKSTIEAMGHNAVKALLRIQDLSGPAKRYMRGMTIDDTILQHRQKLPTEIAELYGQIEDIPTLIASTLTRQGELSARTDFLNRLRDATHSDGRPMVVAKSEAALPGFEDYTVELSAESFGPVKGMMTTPELGQMLGDYSEMFMTLADTLDIVGYKPSAVASLAGTLAGRALTAQARVQKRMSILTRPDFMLMNLAGSVVSPVMVGGVSPDHLWRGMKVAIESMLHTADAKGKIHDARISPDMRLALEMGLLDNPVTQEIRNLPRAQLQALIKDMNESGSIDGFKHMMREKGEVGRKAWQVWVEGYSMSDAWVKLPIALQRMDFLSSYYKANGDDVKNEQIMREAADFTKNSTLSMSRVPPLVKGLERVGLTRFGPYIASVFRTLGYMPRNIWLTVDMAVNAKTQEARNIAALMAGRQTAGMLTIGVLTTHGLRMLADAMMDDDERDQMERDRKFMYEGDKYADLLYVGRNAKEERMYFNISRLDQFGPAFDIARALQRQGSVEEKMEVLKKSLADTMIWSASIPVLIKAGYDAVTAAPVQDKGTRLERIIPAQTQMLKDFVDGLPMLDYSDANSLLELVDKFVPAGPVNILDPATSEVADPVGLSEAIFSGALTAIGHKFVTVSTDAALGGAARDYDTFRGNVAKQIKDNLDTRGPEAALDVFVDGAKRERELVRRLGDMYTASVDSGKSPREVMRMLKDAGLDSRTIANVAKGAYTSETADWNNRHSSLLSAQLTREPPRKYWQTDEQREADLQRWREQATEARRRLSIMDYEESE